MTQYDSVYSISILPTTFPSRTPYKMFPVSTVKLKTLFWIVDLDF